MGSFVLVYRSRILSHVLTCKLFHSWAETRASQLKAGSFYKYFKDRLFNQGLTAFGWELIEIHNPEYFKANTLRLKNVLNL